MSNFHFSPLNYGQCECTSSTDRPTSSTSTRDTSGSCSAPPFFLFFLTCPPSPATASRNLFWLCDFWDLRTKKKVLNLFAADILWSDSVDPFAPFPLFAQYFSRCFPAVCQTVLTVIGDCFHLPGQMC